MMKRLLLIPTLLFTLAGIALMSTSAMAADLHSAKAQGLIGEQPNGYLGIVKSNVPADVRALVADINAKRKAHYQAIAKRNNTSLNIVEQLAGKKAIEKTPSGQYVRMPSGSWVKK